jgi:large subunit ribosomal protein L4
MKVDVFKIDGTPAGRKVELKPEIFEAKPNEHVVYLAVKAYLANQRQGTHSTKTRSRIRGGGRKPWRQKGRGVARAGSIRSPLWVGGARIHGPQPRSYRIELPRKVKRLARISVLSEKVRANQMTVIEDFTLEEAKTRQMASILAAFESQREKVLLLLREYDEKVLRAGRNIPNLQIQMAENVSAYDLLNCRRLMVQEGAIAKIEGVLAK